MQFSKEIEELNDLLLGRWVSGLWNLDHGTAVRPQDRVQAHLWKWHDVVDSLVQAKEKITVARGSVERRVIRLVNPGLAETEMTSHTILLSFQLIQPGEVAPAHRHPCLHSGSSCKARALTPTSTARKWSWKMAI
jgi:gentisate 1,2-dioxygenase